MSEWSKEKELKILKRSKWLLTLKILRIIALIILGYFLYMMVIMLISESLDSTKEDAYYTQVATSMKYPNRLIDWHTMTSETINAIGTRTFSGSLTKRVGQDDQFIGQVHVTRRLFANFSTLQHEYAGKKEMNPFSFALPSEQTKQRNANDEVSNHVWQRLDKLPEGTVAEFKFTTTDYMTPEQLLKKLERYDLHVLWMPLFTGEFERFTPNMYGTGNGGISSYDSIGLYGGDHHADDEFGSRTAYTQLLSDRIAESEDMYVTNLAELLDKGQSYYESFLGLTYLPERYEYLQTDGFKVYGAVVTGPTKELLKLREETGIHEVQLGDVALWNWEQVE